jgi:hypothetical protein
MNWAGWLPAFLATLAIEAPVFLFALWRPLGMARAIATTLGLNALTHPLAWSMIMVARQPFPGVFLSVESAVWVIEALLLWHVCRSPISRRRLPFVEALAISLAANGFSAGIGLLL